MKKLGVFAVLAIFAVAVARADVEALFWQVTDDNNPNNVTFDYAAFAALDGSGNVVNRFADTDGGVFQGSNSDRKSTELIYSVIGDQYKTGYSFCIELWNYDSGTWSLAGTSQQTYSYNDLSSYIHSTSLMSMTALSSMTLTPTVVVPEPTSGMLLLVGGALLALRRRRRA